MSTPAQSIRPIQIIPWSEDFIQALADVLAQEAQVGSLAATRVIFPHNRPARHLRGALAAHALMPRPAMLPRMQSLDEFLRQLRLALSPTPLTRAGSLDRIGLLHGVVRELGLKGGPLAALDASPREFFPWGARLAGLLDELAAQGVTAQNVANLSGEVLPWAEALLGQLSDIDAAYRTALDARGWTTPGLDARWLAHNQEAVAEALGGQQLILAGFYALSGAEEAIFRLLWSRLGARLFWHTDPALALGNTPDWAAREHAAWLRRWSARAELAVEPDGSAPRQLRRLYEGFDLHSQLHALERELAALPEASSTAIVLPDPGALTPVLHHLPASTAKELNISMGYPLRRSSLAQLVECLLALHENAQAGDGPGRYHWRDLIALSRQPSLRMLELGGERPLASLLRAWERHIRASGAFQAPSDWLPVYEADQFQAGEQEVRALFARVLTVCFDNFRSATTLRALGRAVSELCALLREFGGEIWQTFLIDAECLLRLWQSVVPELTGSILADEEYDRGLLFLILRHLIELERVSFEPEPLAGLQVLGMLETRLLRFDRLFILDATEDKLPGTGSPDPLLPDPLRRALGLPGARERDNVAAHNFFRLLNGAREVCVLYQAGTRPGALEGKSVRSRYVEQLLWDEERRTGALIKPLPMTTPEAPLRLVDFPVSAILPRRKALPVTDAVRARLAAHMGSRGVTPSSVEDYLSCPKLFYFRRVLGLRALDEVAEEGDRARFGEVVHSALRRYLEPRLGAPILAGQLDNDQERLRLHAILGEELSAGAFTLDLPFDARTVLAAAARERFSRFLAGLPATTVVALERKAEAVISLDTLSTPLTGQFDRVDLRQGGHVVLDYKTGKIPERGGAPWLDSALFERISGCVPGGPEAEDLLASLSELDLDVQLPLYLHLLESQGEFTPVNAAWVELGKSGAERPLFAEDVSGEERREVMTHRAPALLRLALGHMLAAPELSARPGRRCDWCDFAGPCLS